VVFSRQVFLLNPCMHLSSLPHVPHLIHLDFIVPQFGSEKFRDIKHNPLSVPVYRPVQLLLAHGRERDGNRESALSNWFRLPNRDGRRFLTDWQRQWRFSLLIPHFWTRWHK
jgi:hypothetical protein